MKRREFITLVGGAAVALPLAARAQKPDRMRLLGVLMGYPEKDRAALSELAAFYDALTKQGWTEGNNLRIELRWGGGKADKIGTLANELVKLRPDAILGVTTPATGALARETQTIPIVFTLVVDPIGNGFSANLTHPGGNITGFAAFDPALAGKWVGLLKQVAPRTERVAALFNPATASPLQLYMPAIDAAASSLAMQASTASVRANDEIEGVVAALASNPGGGLIVMPDAFNLTNRELIIALVARYGVPAIYYGTFFAESGGLITYGADYPEEFRQAAIYIDRIFKGAKPADLPIQQATKYELAINMKTAKALGLDVPLPLQQIADVVIE
jgi:putative ABC transport system substrate-binding protein